MSTPLRILVAGAGIGGLAAALACSRAGHAVQVFEKSAALAEVGAGIQLGPNVTRILHQWGLASVLKHVAAFPACLQVRDAQGGQVLGLLRLGPTFEARYGAPYATVHRADLQQLLADTLLVNHGVVPAFGHAVAGFKHNEQFAQLQLTTAGAHNPVLQGDLLVAADGLWSSIRQGLLEDGPPQATGHVAYRCLIRQADLPVALRAALNTQDVVVWLGPRLHVVHYPVRGGEWLNVVVIVENPSDKVAESWSQDVDTQEWGGFRPGLHHHLQDLLLAADGQVDGHVDGSDREAGSWRKWDLFARPAMQRSKAHGFGRVALLGDAAHPMLPYLAQGAGMAIEDAHALAIALGQVKDVSSQVEQFAQARWQRNARVQRRAIRNGQIFHADGVVRWGRDLSMQLFGESLLDLPWLYRGQQRNMQGS